MLARWAQTTDQVSERRVAHGAGLLGYQSHRDPQEALRMRLREFAAARVRFGYRRLTVLLRRNGWLVNAKQMYRLYTEEGLTVRRRCG